MCGWPCVVPYVCVHRTHDGRCAHSCMLGLLAAHVFRLPKTKLCRCVQHKYRGYFVPPRPEKNAVEGQRMTDAFVEERRWVGVGGAGDSPRGGGHV